MSMAFFHIGLPGTGRGFNKIASAGLAGLILAFSTSSALAADATQLVRAAFDNWRAKSSETVVTMVIHRPSWQRSLSMTGWTQGHDKALVRFTAPAKDAGNATLKLGNQTFIYNPKLNQVIKLPASMLSQSWMGSDFSYNDLSKAEDVLTYYTHKIVKTGKSGGHTVYTIEALPKSGAPVVWGKQELDIRDDGVFLKEIYFDQDMKVVRTMTTNKVGTIGGRVYPLVLTMTPADKAGQWTRITTTKAQFDQSLPAYIFTKSNLQNPRD